MRSSSIRVGLLVAMLAIGMALAGCHHEAAESRIRAAIHDAAQAAERDDADGLEATLSEDFDGNDGEFDRRRLAGVLRLLRLRGEHAGVLLGTIDIEPRGERRLATLTVTLSASGDGLLPEAAGVYRIQSAWRAEGGRWRCYSAHWQRAL